MSLIKRFMVFIDGENLVMRFQNMVEQGRVPLGVVNHMQNTYVWSNRLITNAVGDIIRVNYYTSAVGDDDKLHQIRKEIQSFEWTCTDRDSNRTGNVNAKVYKKLKQNERSKGVDINIVIDVLNNIFIDTVDEIILISGDGDFLPLIEKVMDRGKYTNVWAFSDGLNPLMETTPDAFQLLDNAFFHNRGKSN